MTPNRLSPAYALFNLRPNLPQPPDALAADPPASQEGTAVRAEFLAGSSPDAPEQSALLHLKSNLGRLAPPWATRSTSAASSPRRLHFDRPCQGHPGGIAVRPRHRGRAAPAKVCRRIVSPAAAERKPIAIHDRTGRATGWHLHRSSGFRNWCRPKPRIFSWFSLKENHSSPPF